MDTWLYRWGVRMGVHGSRRRVADEVTARVDRLDRQPLFRRKRVPGRLGALSVSRLLAAVVVQAALLYLVVQPLWIAMLGGFTAVVAMVVLFGRSRGRWWTEHAILWMRYRKRRGTQGQPSDDLRLAGLRALAPDLAVENVAMTGKPPLGIGSSGVGWFTVMEVLSSGEGHAHPPVPLEALARIAGEFEQPGVVVQIVSHRTMAASERTLWVAVRLDTDVVSDSMVDDPDSQVAILAALSEVSRRVDRALSKRGLRCRLLDADEILDALTRSCDLVPADRPVAAHEEWHGWRSARWRQGCLWLKTWPSGDRSVGMLAELMQLPGEAVTLAIVLGPAGEATDLCCLIRVATTEDRYEGLRERAIKVVQNAGGELLPLDGEHAVAAYASAPSGGGAW